MERSILKYSILLILTGLVIITFHKPFYEILLPFITEYLSADHKITSPLVIQRGIIFGGLFLIIIGFILSKIDKISPLRKLKSLMWSSDIREFFFKEALYKNKADSMNNGLVFYSSIIIASVIFILYFLGFMKKNSLSGLFMEDGFFESATAILFLIASIILLISFTILRKRSNENSKMISKMFLMGSMAFFLIGMEEISWGQRIFGWATPENLKAVNYQAETNLHNVLNPFFTAGYIVVAISIFLVSIFAWINNKNSRKYVFNMAFPHPSLFVLTFFILIAALLKELELVEELAALYVFFYSMRISRILALRTRLFAYFIPVHRIKLVRIVGLLSQLEKHN